jgi:glycosyltransferase involved in cell wall biosynthesis
MKAPFFTVLIDTYNYGEYIEAAASRALAQDFPAEKREILAADCGSTDDMEERVRKVGEAIRYLRTPNDGKASAFNFGFEHASGESIVDTPTDAIWTFLSSGMHALVIGSFLVEK